MAKVFVISDTHFGHKNIIKYSNRPFANLDEMNEALIDNWNSVVGEKDVVFHLGDLLMGRSLDPSALLSVLNGKKVLIKGNHDDQRVCQAEGWERVFQKFTLRDQGLILRHYPKKASEDFGEMVLMHGHSHGYNGKFGEGWIDMSVESWGYKPTLLEDILEEFRWTEG